MLTVRDSVFDIPDLPSPLRTVGRVLGSSVVDAPDLRVALEALLREEHDSIRAENWTNLRCVIVESLLSFCHDDERQIVYIKEVADSVEAILEGRGEKTKVEDKKIGSILRSAGFAGKRDAHGFKIRLDETVRRRAHELANSLDVATVQIGATLCPYCAAATGGTQAFAVYVCTSCTFKLEAAFEAFPIARARAN